MVVPSWELSHRNSALGQVDLMLMNCSTYMITNLQAFHFLSVCSMITMPTMHRFRVVPLVYLPSGRHVRSVYVAHLHFSLQTKQSLGHYVLGSTNRVRDLSAFSSIPQAKYLLWTSDCRACNSTFIFRDQSMAFDLNTRSTLRNRWRVALLSHLHLH